MTYAALQTSQIILSCICIMCIGMATHLDRESTCTVIETNMVILFGAYLAYFSLTNQSREVTCDFDFASGDGDGCGGWNFDDRDSLKPLSLNHLRVIIRLQSRSDSNGTLKKINVIAYLYLDYDVDDYLHPDGVCLVIYFYFYAQNFYNKQHLC